jgi:hypothetical protein
MLRFSGWIGTLVGGVALAVVDLNSQLHGWATPLLALACLAIALSLVGIVYDSRSALPGRIRRPIERFAGRLAPLRRRVDRRLRQRLEEEVRKMMVERMRQFHLSQADISFFVEVAIIAAESPIKYEPEVRDEGGRFVLQILPMQSTTITANGTEQELRAIATAWDWVATEVSRWAVWHRLNPGPIR